MAYFSRMVHAGSEHDPRSWTYAIYQCDVCGRESEFTVTDNFQARERRCMKCGSMGTDDRVHTLEVRRQNIMKQIADLSAELLDVETELSRVSEVKASPCV